jgi:hypothetical protein
MATNSTKKTWVAILIAVVVLGCVGVIALVGGSAYILARHVRADFVASEDADAQFASARQRFAGRAALIELRDGDEPIVRRPPADAKPAPITVVRALIYSPDERKIVDVSLPVWLLRLAPGHNLSFIDDGHFDSHRIRFSFEDIERHGPGLILDGTDRDGARILVWSE